MQNKLQIIYTRGHSEIIDIPFPKQKQDSFFNLRSKCVKVFTAEVESFFRLLEPRPKERVNFWKEPQRRPYIIINFPSLSQNGHSLRAFLSVLRTGENRRWIDD